MTPPTTAFETTSRCGGAEATVIFVLKRHAKSVKTALERDGRLDKHFRMAPADPGAHVSNSTDGPVEWKDCVAIPLVLTSREGEVLGQLKLEGLVVAQARQWCPYSTSLLGNHNMAQQPQYLHRFSPLQQALWNTMRTGLSLPTNCDHVVPVDQEELLIPMIQSLSKTVCPENVEFLGDDRNIVLPAGALLSRDLLELYTASTATCSTVMTMETWQSALWQQVAYVYGDRPRVLRKGRVDPESRIRHSGYQRLWPPPWKNKDEDFMDGDSDWITVTEQGIRQSFPFTKVMFSRGNISEKIRFGRCLVQPGDVVLDLYAGIGYYTLPAVLLGKAAHVYSCEWNPQALQALQRNLEQNHVASDRVTVLPGDCRQLGDGHLRHRIQRISLGLLPSSQGGWAIAIRALLGTLSIHYDDSTTSNNTAAGGWLHVHGNVPVQERQSWAQWVCQSLMELVVQESENTNSCHDWIAVCHHVEKVKSFAPTIYHLVADVYVGPRDRAQSCCHPQHPQQLQLQGARDLLDACERCFVYHAGDNEFRACPAHVLEPSCALSPDGPLHQTWMH